MPSPMDLQVNLYAAREAPHASSAQRLPKLPRLLLVFPMALGLICVACGAVGSNSSSAPASPPSLTLQPTSAQPFTGGTVQFSTTVANAARSAVTWQVNQVPGGNATVGTITTAGYYVAPNSVPNPPTVTVTAVSQADPTLTGSAKVTILSLATIQGPLTLSPALASVTTSQPLQLQVLTTGVTSRDVNWAVDGVANGSAAVGTISVSVSGNYGLYTPGTATGAHLVTATLIANPNAIGSATVEVTDFSGTLTWRNDNSRSGVNNRELALSPATVASSTFGKLFSCPIDGYAYAQPLYVANLAIPGNGTHNVVFVATEKDLVYAFVADASPCVQLWKAILIPQGSEAVPTPNLDIASTDIVPFVGITGTPVINLTTLSLYVVAETTVPRTGLSPNATYSHQLYALNLATGQQTQSVGIQVVASSPQLSFNPMLENQRAALLLDNGTVYIAFASHGGEGPYHGWLLGYDSSLQQTGVFNDTPGATQGGGIWQSGGGPAADLNHNLFVATGDGPFDVNRGGMNYGDSFLRLGTNGGLSVPDYFTPCDQIADQTAATDVGATAPVLLPDLAGSAAPHLVIGGSKNGSLYVVNRDNMGGYVPSPCPANSPPPVQTISMPTGANPSPPPIFGTPLFWNNSIYVAPGNSNLMSFSMSAGGVLNPTPSATQLQESLGPQGATPVISSNGTSNAILWLIDTSGAFATPNGPAILRAYDPSNQLDEIYNSAMSASRDKAGSAVKFTVPTVANGKVYLGTQTELDVYGLLR